MAVGSVPVAEPDANDTYTYSITAGDPTGAFDIDNNADFLNSIPFADHGALLDPPTADVTARCVSFLAQTGVEREHPVIKRAIDYLKKEQEDDDSWFGR